MAKATIINTEPRAIGASQSIWKVVLLAFGLGLIYWVISFFVEKYIIGKFFCGLQTALICQNIVNVSGNIAIILTAIIGIVLMVRLRMVQPLIVSVASSIVLWGISSWTNGLVWYETIVCDVVLYLLAYVLFSWIVRCKSLAVALIISGIIIALLYIILSI